eukprot:522814_1
MEEFSCMIFNHLYQKFTKQTKQPTLDHLEGLQVDHINHEMSNIISQRESKGVEIDDTPDKPPPSLNMSDLTDVLVQEIASFLPFKSYTNFQRCSRSIFYAANTPSTLYELEGQALKNSANPYQNMHQTKAFMKRFERIQKLTVSSSNESLIPLIQFKNLKHLMLYVRSDNFDEYLSKNVFNWNEIRTLRIYTGNTSNTMDVLTRCTNLVTLAIGRRLDDANNTFSQRLTELRCLSTLQCLVLERDITNLDARILLKNISNKLQALSIHSCKHKVDGMTFHNLVELHIYRTSSQEIVSILKTTKRLKRLFVSFKLDLPDENKSADLKSNLHTIFGLDTLEYFGIEFRRIHRYNGDELSVLCRCIQTAFHKKRHKLKLEIRAHTIYTKDNELHEPIASMWNTLCAWSTKHCMLTVTFCVKVYEESSTLNQWLEGISNAVYVATDKKIGKRYGSSHLYRRVVIANKCNTFNGYVEQHMTPSRFFSSSLPSFFS